VPRAQSPRGPPGRPRLQAVGPQAPRREAAPQREARPRVEASRREVAWPAREPSLPRASCSRARQSTDNCFANCRSDTSSNSGDVSCTQRRWVDDGSEVNYQRLEAVHGRSPPTEPASITPLACEHPAIVSRGVFVAPRQSLSPDDVDHTHRDIKNATKKNKKIVKTSRKNVGRNPDVAAKHCGPKPRRQQAIDALVFSVDPLGSMSIPRRSSKASEPRSGSSAVRSTRPTCRRNGRS